MPEVELQGLRRRLTSPRVLRQRPEFVNKPCAIAHLIQTDRKVRSPQGSGSHPSHAGKGCVFTILLAPSWNSSQTVPSPRSGRSSVVDRLA
jgi:hypothetical protein